MAYFINQEEGKILGDGSGACLELIGKYVVDLFVFL